MRTTLYLILIVILTTFFFQACTKEDDVVQGNTEQVVLKDSVHVENRNGTISPIFYTSTNSLTYHQKFYQMSFNKDSIVNINFVRTIGPLSETYTKSLGTLDPGYNKAARKYDITVTLTDTIYFFPATWIKDTTAITFNKVGSINLFPGSNKKYATTRLDQPSLRYYDTGFKKLKDKFYYNVQLDNYHYIDDIISTNTGNIFWLNHKM